MLRIMTIALVVSAAGLPFASQASESKPVYHGETGRTAADLVSCTVKKWEARTGGVAVSETPNGKRITINKSGKVVATLEAITTDSLTNVDVTSDQWSKQKADPYIEDVRGCI